MKLLGQIVFGALAGIGAGVVIETALRKLRTRTRRPASSGPGLTPFVAMVDVASGTVTEIPGFLQTVEGKA